MSRVYLYDTTLRDGAQTQGVDFNVADKAAIAHALNEIGIDYIEAGWPGANPTDNAFFKKLPALSHSKFAAFGMTRRSGKASDDQGLMTVLQSTAPAACLVGKAWDFQVTEALGITREENVQRVTDSIQQATSLGKEVIFDAKHFFDGYKENAIYTLKVLQAAKEAGARWLVLCDTNGGMLPQQIKAIINEITPKFDGETLGIHCHNDTENAVANSLAAVEAGVRLVHGTINGLGERCGNANLISIIPALKLKMGFDVGIDDLQLKKLVTLSRLLDERLDRIPNRQQPYVGASAFAHKGGLHVSAVEKNPRCYEHIEPEQVGNQRVIVVSDQAGRSNILSRLKEVDINLEQYSTEIINSLVDLVKQQEFEGYAYDTAGASFELLARRHLDQLPEFFNLNSFRVIDERRWNAKGDIITLSEATVKATVEGTNRMSVAEGNGPVNALDKALKKVLLDHYPQLNNINLVDYKVRILTANQGTQAVTRVLIECEDETIDKHWSTVGVSTNVIDASYRALQDGIIWRLLQG